jgi:N-succinyldiaminopimelate aminotransferase
VNPHLALLQPYPFEKLQRLFTGVAPPKDLPPIRLSIGEPQHETPEFIKRTLTENLSGLASYPSTQGNEALRQAIADWIGRRYGLPAPDPETQVLPVNGSREALFAFAQTVVNSSRGQALVLCPNPFYQIYEGAALLAGAKPIFLNTLPEHGFALDFDALTAAEWQRVQLVYICSPSNPTGKVLDLQSWRKLFALSDQYGFVIASDECYSEIYFCQETQQSTQLRTQLSSPLGAPLGSLQAARQLGRDDYRNLVMFSSLSKRSNVPGMRSGFVAGNAALIRQFLLYRTYHGSAMSPAVQAASIAAWNDEAHVRDNRRLYAEKFARVTPLIAQHLDVALPEAGFYLWISVAKFAPISDTDFARELLRQYNVIVLPGSFLARESGGINPGANFLRVALVASVDECIEAAHRIAEFCLKL